MRIFIHFRKGTAAAFFAAVAAFGLIYHTGYYPKPFDVFFVAALLLMIFNLRMREAFRAILPSINVYLALLVVMLLFIGLGDFLGDSSRDFFSAMHYGRILFNGAVFLATAFLIFHHKNLLFYLSWGIFLAPVVVVPALLIRSEGFYTHGSRLMGFLQNPINFGLWMAIVFVVGVGLFFQTTERWKRWFVAGWLAVIASFLLWAASRASWLSLLLGVLLLGLVYFAKREPKRKIVALLAIVSLVFALGYAMLPNEDLKIRDFVAMRTHRFLAAPFADQFRTEIWRAAHPFSLENPWGVGFGAAPVFEIEIGAKSFTAQVTSNVFLEIALYGGWGALIAFLLLLGILFKRGIAALMQSGTVLFDLRLAWTAAAALTVVDLFFNDGFLWRHFWFVLGVFLGVSLLSSTESVEKERERNILT